MQILRSEAVETADLATLNTALKAFGNRWQVSTASTTAGIELCTLAPLLTPRLRGNIAKMYETIENGPGNGNLIRFSGHMIARLERRLASGHALAEKIIAEFGNIVGELSALCAQRFAVGQLLFQQEELIGVEDYVDMHGCCYLTSTTYAYIFYICFSIHYSDQNSFLRAGSRAGTLPCMGGYFLGLPIGGATCPKQSAFKVFDDLCEGEVVYNIGGGGDNAQVPKYF